jgi:hypothetical protein
MRMNSQAHRYTKRVFVVGLSVFLGTFIAEAQTIPPYVTDFETANGVSVGNLNNQDGWQVAQGSASVTAALASSGANSVLLAQNSPPTQITHSFGAPATSDIV